MNTDNAEFHLAWVDLETTGLERSDHLLELAVVFTDAQLNEISSFETLIRPAPSTFDRIVRHDAVRQMHERSGLTAALHAEGADAPTTSDAERVLVSMVQEIERQSPGTTIHIAGGGVANFDLPFLRRRMPTFAKHLHYRPIDTSLIASAYRMATGDAGHFQKRPDKAHRAMADIREDLEVGRKEWRMFRSFGAAMDATTPEERLHAGVSLVEATVRGDSQGLHEAIRSMPLMHLNAGVAAVAGLLAMDTAAAELDTPEGVLHRLENRATAEA